MKMIKTTLIALAISATASAKTIPAGDYSIDGMHSKIGFEISHLVISSVEGTFQKYEGTIKVDKKANLSKAEVTIDVDSINTGVTKRDDHLKSADFFDVQKFPKMTFASSDVKITGDTLKIKGLLKIKDQSKEVTLAGKYLGEVKDGYGQNKIAFKASTKINRKDFGLTWSQAVEAGPVVGDQVEITLNIQATLKK